MADKISQHCQDEATVKYSKFEKMSMAVVGIFFMLALVALYVESIPKSFMYVSLGIAMTSMLSFAYINLLKAKHMELCQKKFN
jgi:hypothetical protein